MQIQNRMKKTLLFLLVCLFGLIFCCYLYNHRSCERYVAARLEDGIISETLMEIQCNQLVNLLLFNTVDGRVGSALIKRNPFSWTLLYSEIDSPDGAPSSVESCVGAALSPVKAGGLDDTPTNLHYRSGYIRGICSQKVLIGGEEANCLYFPQDDFTFCFVLKKLR